MPVNSALKQANLKELTLPKRRSFNRVRMLARPDEWAIGMGLRVDGRPFSLQGREYVKQVIRDMSPEIVIPKAAQMAFTVTFLTRSIQFIVERKWHHLYLLPLKTGAIPFVQARIDPILESNDLLSRKFQTVDNRLHKQSTDAINLYIRGTNIERELQEIPVDVQVWDERDRMVEDNLEEARARMDGSHIQKLTILSTPTVPGHGVDSDDEWWASDMHRWEVPCPGCGRFQVLNFEENIRLGDTAEDSVLECQFCHRGIKDHERTSLNQFGRWVATNLNGRKRGYHISQFNSPSQTLVKILEGYFTGQKNARKLKSFHNQKLGQPYVAAGDKITPEILDKCIIKGQSLGGIPESAVFCGVDIGTFIHVMAYVKDRFGNRRLWKIVTFREWDQLDRFFADLSSFVAVIDAHPEKRAARDLSIKYHGKVWLGFEMDRPQTNELSVWHPLKTGEAGKVVIDRTMAFDTTTKEFIDGKVHLPWDARELGDFIQNRDYNGFYFHLIQMTRVEEEDAQGRIIARWKKNKNPDHFHHADMFARIALEQMPALEVPIAVSRAFDQAGSIFNG